MKTDGNHSAKPTKTSRAARLMGVRVLGVGSSVPERVVRNEDLAELGYDAEWIVQRSGILARRHADPETATSDLALEAGRRAMEHAGVAAADIDLLIVGTYTPDLLLPSTACLVQNRLGLNAPAMDLNAACASFAYAMVTAAQFIAAGTCRRALVVGADCNSRVVDPADRHTYPLFGDGAGAVVLGPGDSNQGLVSYVLGADGSGADLLCRRLGGTRTPFTAEANAADHFLAMDGRAVFKWATRILADTVDEVLSAAGMALGDVDLWIFHQANLRIIHSAMASLGIDPNRVFNNLDRYGNTAAGSIPLALDEAYREGRIAEGSHVLVSGFGAGLAWGTALIRW